jgi:hypothetical protein
MTRRVWAAAIALVVLSLVTRLPALLNASGTNSDAAVVGLQACHVMHGEWSPFLWGSGYQTSADSTWAALFFFAAGKTPIALMLSALTLYVALTLLVFFTLRRHVASTAMALCATLPLVFTTACVHSYALYPPRQLALMLAFAAWFAIDRGTLASLAMGGLAAMLAWVADPYAMIFAPGALLLAILVVLRTRAAFGPRAWAMTAFFAGVAAGAVALAALFARPRAEQGVAAMSAGAIGHNAKLLVHVCLPWVIGTKIFKPLHAMDYVAWKMPLGYAVFAYAGAASLAVSLAGAIVAAVRAPKPASPDPLRALAVVAWLTIALNIASFLLSLMVMDEFSMRYLAASVLVLPFALAPLIARFGARATLVLAPYLAVAFVGGWLAHGNWVRGPIPIRTDAGRGVTEARVLEALRERKVEAATADYWASYRLAFLWHEAIPVAPFHAAQDRYPPYRAKLTAAHRFAYIHDRDRSFEDPASAERELTVEGKVVDRFTWDGFDVVVIDR